MTTSPAPLRSSEESLRAFTEQGGEDLPASHYSVVKLWFCLGYDLGAANTKEGKS